ncbi:MAG TPA: protein-L-isoaspartate(D-aspartate) O-methyltransferase [Anaerolineae bacterium]|nr:protein-L-isoaspartate(D-aspartate) O-methyltransferase [Anaerolineae bacterium]HQH39654.1 protein-L-isoaspartate(D-aspartate) O-methyltransferase [Anaerolineae bacterium]
MDQQGMVALIRSRGVRDALVLGAMERVPRHRFVPEAQRAWAYDDHAMSIGCQQTISQPYIVALMTEALDLQVGDRVLEVGTGSGYQAAILAEMGMDVYTIERIPDLYTAAKACLDELGYTVHICLGDGYYGWPKFAPYDGIVVTAAAAEIPPALLEQLAADGRLVIPLGPHHGYQTLWKVVKHGDDLHKIDLGGVAFVPFITP